MSATFTKPDKDDIIKPDMIEACRVMLNKRKQFREGKCMWSI